MAEKLSKTIFYTIIILFPVNLGYHFVIKEAYIGGLLIDYLIPTIYFQDILVCIFLSLNIKGLISQLKNIDKYLVWFLFVIFLTSISSVFISTSLTSFTRLFLCACFMLVVKKDYSDKLTFKNIVGLVAWSVTLLSVLALWQWFKQGSVFNNYLVLGEQPYSISTPGINIENFFGKAKVPPYATFRHPNILGGILSILLIWFLFYMDQFEFIKVPYILGLATLLLTLSKFSWISFLLGVVYYVAYKKGYRQIKYVIAALVFFTLTLSLCLPLFTNIKALNSKPSFYRRADLMESSYEIIKFRPLFGVGYASSTAFIDKYLPPKHDIRFAQPPHNMFVLVFLEAGALALFFFSAFLFRKVRNSFTNNILYISLMQIIFLGLFDHYFFTIHQPQLLFWLILGLI